MDYFTVPLAYIPHFIVDICDFLGRMDGIQSIELGIIMPSALATSNGTSDVERAVRNRFPAYPSVKAVSVSLLIFKLFRFNNFDSLDLFFVSTIAQQL